jgi:hypothetical protein
MPLTHDFKETIRERAHTDPNFRQALLCEAVGCVINGDLATGKAVLRGYVNATVGFQNLEKQTRNPAKSLMRMLGPNGSTSAANLFGHPLRVIEEGRRPVRAFTETVRLIRRVSTQDSL